MRDGACAPCLTRRGLLALVAALPLAGCGAAAGASTDTPASHDVIVRDSDAKAVDAPAVATTPVAAAFAAGEVASVRLVGDSITDGYGCDGFGEHAGKVVYQGGEGIFYESAATFGSWANDFRAYSAERGVAADAFVNAGISGARMSWLADEPDAWLADADVIVVMLGTNDAAWSDLAQYEADASVALAAAAARCAHLVVVSPPDNWRDDGRAQFGMPEADEVLARVCDHAGYLHVSALDAVAPDDGTISADGIHPTTAGSHAIWDAVRTQLGLG